MLTPGPISPGSKLVYKTCVYTMQPAPRNNIELRMRLRTPINEIRVTTIGRVKLSYTTTRGDVTGVRVAILADNGFEQDELTMPKRALDDAGAETKIVSPQKEVVKGWKSKKWGDKLQVDVPLDQANPDSFDALLLPGGVTNADSLRIQPDAVQFVKSFFTTGKPVAVICHGPWAIIEAGEARNRRMTSWPSLKTDLRNAGAEWVDQEVVVDGNLVSSRKPDDIPAFNSSMIDVFGTVEVRMNHVVSEMRNEEPHVKPPPRDSDALDVGLQPLD
jgi:protease I